MIADPRLAINWNRRLDDPRTRQYERRHHSARKRHELKALKSTRKLLGFAVLLGLAFFQSVIVVSPAYGGSTSVNIQNFAFNPQNMTIQVGDTVTWTNNDPVVYILWFTNSSDGSTYLMSKPINPGTAWTFTFPNSLKLNYYDFDRLYIIGQLTVVPILKGDFSPIFSNSTKVTFGATGFGGTSPYQFSWNFGDGTTGTGTRLTHIYNFFLSYSVTLTITDSSLPNPFSITVTHVLVLISPGGGGGGRRPLLM